MQGYYFAKPLSPEKLARYLAENELKKNLLLALPVLLYIVAKVITLVII